MQILFLADRVFEDLPGGSRVVARELARGLAGRGNEVTFLVGRQGADGPDETLREGVRIVRFPATGNAAQYIRAGQSACAELWADAHFDVVHTHFAYAALGPLKAIPKTVPRVRTFHGPWDEEGWLEDTQVAGLVNLGKARLRRKLRYQVEATNLRGSARVLTLSDCFRQMVTQHYRMAPEKVMLIAGGTDTTRFQPADDKQACRQKLGLPLNRRLLLSIRRLAPRMGLNNLIKAMPAVVARHLDVLLLIGGKGPERERLERLVADLGMGDYVRLVGFIPDAQLAAYYQSADLFVLPTVALEGFGLVTTEALACGVPVIGTPVGATPEILEGLDKRLIAPGTSPDALAQTIIGYLQGAWTSRLTPERLHRYAADNYTWERHVTAVEAIYASLLNNAR